MDKNEYVAWQDYMKSRRGKWSIDPIHNGTDRDLIAFVPSRDDHAKGVYVAIDGPTVTAGHYEDGDPHITEGMFTVEWGLSVLDGTRPRHGCAKPSSEAFKLVAERLGVRFLVEAICL